MDYHVVSQGKTTIPNVDDGEEFHLTDVRHRPIPLPLTHNLKLPLKFRFLYEFLQTIMINTLHMIINGTNKTNATC